MSVSRMVRAMQFYHLSRRGAVLLAGIVLAKSGLSLEIIGIYETLMFLAMVFSFFWVESFIKGYLSLYETWEDHQQRRSIFSIYLLYVLVSLILCAFLWVGQAQILNFFTGSSSLKYLVWLVAYLILFQPTGLTAFVLQLRRKTQAVFTYAVINTILFILCFCSPLILGYDLEHAMKGLVLYGGVMHLYTLIILGRLWLPSFDRILIYRLLVVSAPIILYTIVQSFAGVFDAWLVNHTYGDKASFAIFRFGARELPLVLPLVVGVSNLALPMINKSRTEGLDLIKKESGKLLNILFPISAVLILFSHDLFEIVYNEEFRSSAAIFNVYLLLIIPQMLYPQTVLMAERKNKILVYIGICEVVLNVILSVWFVGQYGMVGIAYGTFVAFLFEKIALIFWTEQKLGVRAMSYTPMTKFLVYSVLLLVLYLVVGYYNGFLIG